MMSKSVRLFVGNLPSDISESDLAQEFSYYGTVDRAEVKQKAAQDSSAVQSTFAFITIAVDDRALEQLLREFKEQPFRGQLLQVSVARENFLEKLKREREEASQYGTRKTNDALNQSSAAAVGGALPSFAAKIASDDESSSESSDDEEPVVEKPKFAAAKANSRYFGSDDGEEDEVDSTFLKKKSKRFLQNGKIKIDRTGCDQEAIHVINKKTVKAKTQLDEKSKKADDKRKESVQKMKQSYDMQKSLIKNALAGVDGPRQNKKICFDDEEGGPAKASPKAPAEKSKAENKHKQTLFDDDNDDEEEFTGNFEIKAHLEGEQGKRLMKLQSRYHGDSRFKLDAKFLEDDRDGADDDERPYQMDNEANNADNDEDDERRWQYNILEGVVGRKLYTAIDSKKKAPPTMLRFDPTRSDHSKFVEAKQSKQKRKKNKDDADIPAKRAKGNAAADEPQPQSDEPPVSMEHFYEVRGDFQKSLGGGGFSLLSMFNRTGDDEPARPAAGAVDKPYEEKLIAKNSVKFMTELDPFKHESSDEEGDGKADSSVLEAKELDKSVLKHEPFFMLAASDARLAEGLLFFKPPEKADGAEEADGDYNDDQRQELRNIVKRKMKKSIQSALPRHAKANKKFRRFAKNL